MADVDITSLSVEISAESSGAELNIDKLATAISNLRTKGNVTKVVNSLDKLSASISALKQASTGLSGLDNITNFLNGIGNANFSGSVKSINSIVNAIKKIPAAVSGLNGVDFYSMSGSITELTNAMAPLSILDASGLKAIGSAVNAIGKIPDLSEKLKASDLDAFSESCNKISTALTPLASQLDKVGNAFAKLPPQLSKVVTQANRVTKANEKAGKSYLSLSSQINSFMKRAAQLVSLRAIAQYIGDAVVKFNDYYEAANLFGVSMKNLTGEASTFINKMEDLLGIDPTEAMNNMATIQSLTTSFGLASDKAYVLSKNLTQLGYDLASLKNIPVAESFTKIQAAISGELEPIRRLGVDLSQARLQQELLALGFTQNVSTLSQADKAVLRYIAIMKQTTDAQGDFARTISSPANQIRVLKAQLESLARSVGSLLYPALSSILPPLIAAVELAKELVQWIAKLMGVNVEFPDFGNASADIGGVSDALDDTTDSTKKAAKALKNYVMGFDELNIIQKDNGSSSGSGSGSGATGNILGDVDLSGYDMFKDYVGNAVDEIKAKFESLKGVIAAIGIALAGLSLAKLITDIGDAVSKMGILEKVMASIATFTIEAVLVYKFEKNYAETGNVADLILSWATTGIASYIGYKAWGPAGLVIGFTVSYLATLKAQADALSSGKESFGDASTWISILNEGLNGMAIALGVSVLTPFAVGAGAAALTGFSVGALIAFEVGLASIKDKLSQYPIMEEITKIVERVLVGGVVAGAALLLGATAGVAAVAATAAVGILIGFNLLFGKPKKDKESEVDALSGADKEVDETLGKFETAVRKKLDDAQKWLNERWNDLNNMLSGIWDSLYSSISEGLERARNKIDEMAQPFVDAFRGILDAFSAENVQNKLTEVGNAISDKFNGFVETIKQKKTDAMNAMGEWLEGLKSGVANKIESVKEKVGEVTTAVKNVFESLGLFDVGKNLIQGLINGINDMITAVTTKVGEVANGILEKAKKVLGINSPSKEFYSIGEFVTQGLVNGINDTKALAQKAMKDLSGAVKEKGRELADENYGLGKFLFGFSSNTFSSIGDSLKKIVSGSVKNVQNAFSKLNLSFSDWFKKMKSSFSEFFENVDSVSKFGQEISKGFTDAVNSMSNVSKSILDVKNAFTNTVNSLKTFVQNSIAKAENSYNYSGGGINGILSAIGSVLNDTISNVPSVLENFGKVISAIEAAISSLKKLAPMLDSSKEFILNLVTSNPKLAIAAAAIAGIVSILTAAWNSSEKLRNSLIALLSTVSKSFENVFNVVKSAFDSIVNSAESGFQEVDSFIENIFGLIGDVLGSVVSWLSPLFAVVGDVLSKAFGIVSKISEYIVDILNPILKGIISILNSIIDSIRNIWNDVSSALSPAFESVWNTVSKILGVVLDLISTVITSLKPLVDSISHVLDSVFSTVGKLISSLMNSLSPVVIVVAKILGSVLNVAAKILGVVADALKPVIEIIGEILSAIFDVLESIISAVSDALKPVIDVISSAIQGIGNVLKGVANIFIAVINGMINGVEAFINIWIKGINLVIGALNQFSVNIPDWVPIIGGNKFGFNLSEVNEVSLERIQAFATGGMPDSGQVFIARESGPEMVGQMGSSNAVANNEQIVDGIREGVEDAMKQQNELLRKQNELLQALLEKDTNAEISVSSFSQAISRMNQRAGKSIIPVGT